MTTVTRHWADVFVDDVDDKVRLQQKALFFMPSVLTICDKHHITVSGLASTSVSQQRHGNPLPMAGRAVIQSVFQCKQPVAYDSMVRFINLVNFELRDRDQISLDHVIACVFRLRDTEIIRELGVSEQQIQQNCKLSAGVVGSAIKRMRISYNDADLIRSYLLSVKSDKKYSTATVDQVLTRRQEDFIRTDSRDDLPIAIMKLGKKSDEKAEYVYNRYNLTVAPRSGHPWAIDVPVARRA